MHRQPLQVPAVPGHAEHGVPGGPGTVHRDPVAGCRGGGDGIGQAFTVELPKRLEGGVVDVQHRVPVQGPGPAGGSPRGRLNGREVVGQQVQSLVLVEPESGKGGQIGLGDG